jgi:hypothetical protein
LQIANLASMLAAHNATSTFALIVIFTSMRARTIALVVRVDAISLNRDAIFIYSGVVPFPGSWARGSYAHRAALVPLMVQLISCHCKLSHKLTPVARLFEDQRDYR